MFKQHSSCVRLFFAQILRGKVTVAALPNLVPPSSLDEILSSFVAESTAQTEPSVIHAGHYALFRTSDGRATDYLSGENSASDVLGFVKFSRMTWRAACQAIARATAATQPRLIVLVNDWQHLEPVGDNKRASKRAADRSRTEYYSRTPTLPQFHLDELESHGIPTDVILSGGKDRWQFSENALRNELHPIIKEIQADEQRAKMTGIRKYFSENGEPIIEICDDEDRNLCLSHCGSTNCAGEVISLLGNLYRRGVRHFLNIYPSQCREPVSAGTRLAYKIFNCHDFAIVNVALPISNTEANGQVIFTERFGRED